MSNNLRKQMIALLLLLCAGTFTVRSQVTIGSGIEPIKGAVLDLKEWQQDDGTANSTKGLMLPRVILTDLSRLSGGPDGSPAIIGVANTLPDTEIHIGLTVYNLGSCPGVYVWTGSVWVKLGKPCIPPSSPFDPVDGSFCGPSGTAILSVSVGTDETADWYADETGGTPLPGGEGTLTFTTPTITATTPYYAQARNTTTGEVSATRTAVTATQHQVAPTVTVTSSGSITVVYITGMDDDLSNDHYDAATIPTFTVNVTGTGSFSYQWQVKQLGGSYSDIPQATDAAYTPANQEAGQSSYDYLGLYYYRCNITQTAGCDATLPTTEFVLAWGCGAFDINGQWKTFMCHNLGADESLDPFSYAVGNEDGSGGTLGSLFQWGRVADGHEKRNSPVSGGGAVASSNLDANGQVLSSNPAFGSIIPVNGTFRIDWRQTQDDTLWGYDESQTNSPKSINDPCPVGWKVLSHTDWRSVQDAHAPAGTDSQPADGKMIQQTGLGYTVGRHLCLIAAGERFWAYGNLIEVGTKASYWTTTPRGGTSYMLAFGLNANGWQNRTAGHSVRCVSE